MKLTSANFAACTHAHMRCFTGDGNPFRADALSFGFPDSSYLLSGSHHLNLPEKLNTQIHAAAKELVSLRADALCFGILFFFHNGFLGKHGGYKRKHLMH